MSGELMEKIPIVNFGAFIHGTKKDRVTIARQVGQACEGIGFFLLSGHDVPAADIRDMSTVSREYFASPVLEKERARMRTDRYRGYLPVGGQTAALTRGKNTPADILLTVDAARLVRAKEKGLLQKVNSAVLNEVIPDSLRDVDLSLIHI